MNTISSPSTKPSNEPKGVFGPYSPWPRRFIAPGVLVGTVGTIIHCGLPMLA